MKKNPIILSSEKDGRIVYIEFVDGKKYKVQHPGNREHLQWQQETFDFENGLDTVSFMDKAFDHCIIPEGHNFKPTIDNVTPQELGVWQKFLRQFLKGEIVTPPIDQEREGEMEKTSPRTKRGS